MTAQGRITAYMYQGLKRKTVLELELDGNQAAQLEELDGKEISIEISQHRKKRSLSANSYAWALIGKLADATGLPPLEVYRSHIRDLGVYRDVEIDAKAEGTLSKVWSAYGMGWIAERVDSAGEGKVMLRLWYGSSSYNSKQMARLIDGIVQDCQALGIETKTPEEIAKLMSLWEGER